MTISGKSSASIFHNGGFMKKNSFIFFAALFCSLAFVGCNNGSGTEEPLPGEGTVPGNPTGIPIGVNASAVSSSSIKVTWFWPSEEANPNGFYVYRSSSENGNYSRVGRTSLVEVASGVYYTHTGLTASTTYYYKVSAYNSAGEGPQSFSISATTTADIPTVSGTYTQGNVEWGIYNTITFNNNNVCVWREVSGGREFANYTGSYTVSGTTVNASFTMTIGGVSRPFTKTFAIINSRTIRDENGYDFTKR